MSFASRLKSARTAYKKAQSQSATKLDEGDYQLKVVKPNIIEPKKGKQEGHLVVVLPLVVAAGPDAGKKLMPKRYSIIDDKGNLSGGADWLKTDLEKMGLDPDFDFGEVKKVLKQLDGMIFDCFVRDNPTNPQYQDCFINGPVDSLDGLNDEDEEEEEEEVEEPPKRKRGRPKGSKNKPKPKPEPEPEEEEVEDDLLDDEDEDEEEDDWDEEEEEEEDWEED